MGAIFGLFDLAGAGLPPSALASLSELLAQRGTDVAGTWQDARCGLGLRLRHTTPESLSEAPPGPLPGSGLVIACDARIDNRDALRAKLHLDNEGLSDSALVAAAYQAWGNDCATHLVGDFAFAIYNPAREELLCVRDHFGVKPLCYGIHEGRMAFASTVTPLVQAGLVDATPDPSRIADYLLRNLQDKSATFHRGARRLPPAHAMLVSRDGLRTWRYWTPSVAASAAPAPSDDEAAAGFRRHFEEAVRCRLRSAFPVGAFLSGGLDSSSVTLVAARLSAEAGLPLPVFSAVFPDVPASDESAWMASVADEAAAKGWPLQRHVFRADSTGPLDVLDDLSRHLDGPSTAANLYQPWGMLTQARDAGVRVMLTGHDGDTVVSHGFAHLTELAMAGQWDDLARELSAIADGLENYGAVAPVLLKMYVRPAPGLLWAGGHPIRALRALRAAHRRFRLSRRAMLAAFPGPVGWLARAVGRAGGGGAGRAAGSGGAPVGASPAFAASAVFRARAAQPPAAPVPTVQQDHLRALESGLMTTAFEEFEQVSSAFGIESRHPFFDKRLVEYCLALPREQKFRQGWTRVVLRNAMSGILPEAVRLRRDKSNLGHNFIRSLATGQGRIARALDGSNPAMGRFWDLAALRESAARHEGQPNPRDALLLYLVAGFDTWSRGLGK
jgi:asparagine synthase (glutamine-hydrolysing)